MRDNSNKKSSEVEFKGNPHNSKPPPYFNELAPLLESNGYPVVPIKPGTKRPDVVGWNNVDKATREGWQISKPEYHTGLLTGYDKDQNNSVAAWDVDKAPQHAANLIAQILRDHFGDKPSPERIGREPSFMMFHTSTDPINSQMITFTRNKSGSTETFSIHLRGDNSNGTHMQSVISAIHPDTGERYWYRTNVNLINTPRNELPSLTASETVGLIQRIVCALNLVENGGWSTNIKHASKRSGDPDNHANSEVRDVVDADSYFNIPVGGDIPLQERRDMVAFVLRPDGLGIADVGREKWLTTIHSAVDILYDDPDAKTHIVECSESAKHDDWESATEKLVRNSQYRFHRSGNVTGKYILKLRNNNKKLWKAFQKKLNAQRSRVAFERHKQLINVSGDAEQLDSIRLGIKGDSSLQPDTRDRLANLYKAKFNELVPDEQISVTQANKALTSDIDTAKADLDIGAKGSSPVINQVIDAVKNNCYLYTDKHGRAFADITKPSGKQITHLLGDGAMADHIRFEAKEQYNTVLSTNAGKDAEDMLRIIADRSDNTEDVFGRYGQSSDGDTQIEFLHDDSATVIEISAAGVKELSSSGSGVRSVLPKGAEVGAPHKHIDPSDLKKLCKQLLNTLRIPKHHWPQTLAWLVASRHYGTEYPILLIQAPSGAGKSMLTEFLERLVDPKANRQLRASKKIDDLQSAMSASFCTAQHNISKTYPVALQDLMCVASDGEKDSKRKSHTTNTQQVLPVDGPLIICTRHLGMLSEGDVLNRTVILNIGKMPDGVKRLEKNALRRRNDALVERYTPVLRALHSEVLRLLPEMPSSLGEHLIHYKAVGEAVCRILNMDVPFAQVLKNDRAVELQSRLDEHPFLLAVAEYVTRCGGLLETTIPDLLKMLRLDETRDDRERRIESRQPAWVDKPEWPNDNKSAKKMLFSDRDLLSLIGLKEPVTVEDPRTGRAKRTRHGNIYVLKTNENATPKSELPHKCTLVTNLDLPEKRLLNDGRWNHKLFTQLTERYGEDWVHHAPSEMVYEYDSI